MDVLIILTIGIIAGGIVGFMSGYLYVMNHVFGGSVADNESGQSSEDKTV